MKHCVLLCVAVLAAASASGWAAQHDVRLDGTGDFETIGAAVAAAADGDTIWIYPGTYTGPGNRDIEFGAKNLKLRRPYGEWEPVVIDCEYEGRAFLLTNAAIDTSTHFSNITFTHGDGASGRGDGGAVLCVNTSPRFLGCRFIDNTADGAGAVMLFDGEADFIYCLFEGNTAGLGGAIGEGFGAPRFRYCRFIGNEASVGGGAVYAIASDINIRNCTFVRNASPMGGGITLTEEGDRSVTRCIVAFSTQGVGIAGGTTGVIEHNVVFGNDGGDVLPPYAGDNLLTDPLFCDLYGDALNDFCANSPALAGNNDWSLNIGHSSSWGCPVCDSPVDESTWGAIKARHR